MTDRRAFWVCASLTALLAAQVAASLVILLLAGCATDPALVERIGKIEAALADVKLSAETVEGDMAAVKVGGSGFYLAVGLALVLAAGLGLVYLRLKFYRGTTLATTSAIKQWGTTGIAKSVRNNALALGVQKGLSKFLTKRDLRV